MRRVELLLNLTSPPGNTCVPLCRPIQEIAVQLPTLTTVSSGLGEGAEFSADPVGSSLICWSETDLQSKKQDGGYNVS